VGVLPDTDLERIKRYCADKVPAKFQDQIQIAVETRGRSVSILECRPPWRGEPGDEWTRRRIAQLRYNPEKSNWTLHWADSNDKWHLFDLVEPGSVSEMIDELRNDRTSIFWG